MSVFKECKEQMSRAGNGENRRREILFYDKSGIPAIPEELFQSVCREMKRDMFNLLTLFKLAMFVLFMAFALVVIKSFGKFERISIVAKSVGSLLLSSLPKLYDLIKSKEAVEVGNERQRNKISFIVSEFAAGRIDWSDTPEEPEVAPREDNPDSDNPTLEQPLLTL